MKTVVLFGTFNPPTKAHVALAEAALTAVGADRAFFIPANENFAENKMKNEKQCLNSEERVEALKCIDYPFPAKIITAELDGLTNGRTYNTMTYLKNKYDDEFYLVFGVDKISEFDQWYKAENLFAENKFYIFSRNGIKLEDEIIKSKLVSKNKENFISGELDPTYATMSSSRVRKAILENNWASVYQLTPEKVYAYLRLREDKL